MSNLKVFIQLNIIFLFCLFFNDFKEKTFINAKKDYELNIERYTAKLEDRILLFDKMAIEQYIKEATSTNFIKDVKIKYKKYLFTDSALLKQLLAYKIPTHVYSFGLTTFGSEFIFKNDFLNSLKKHV